MSEVKSNRSERRNMNRAAFKNLRREQKKKRKNAPESDRFNSKKSCKIQSHSSNIHQQRALVQEVYDPIAIKESYSKRNVTTDEDHDNMDTELIKEAHDDIEEHMIHRIEAIEVSKRLDGDTKKTASDDSVYEEVSTMLEDTAETFPLEVTNSNLSIHMSTPGDIITDSISTSPVTNLKEPEPETQAASSPIMEKKRISIAKNMVQLAVSETLPEPSLSKITISTTIIPTEKNNKKRSFMSRLFKSNKVEIKQKAEDNAIVSKDTSNKKKFTLWKSWKKV